MWDDVFSIEFLAEKFQWETALRVGLLAILAAPACFLLARLAGKAVSGRFGKHFGALVQRLLLYSGLSVIAISVLVEFGFDLGALLGAAGIVSVAIGFASQTSLSNIISGVFLYGEKPFEVGDIIKVGDKTGVVISIDLLSVKLRQFDNQFVRIPNETMIKSDLVNVTKFPIRRVDIIVGVSYDSDVEQVMTVLKACADQNSLSLDEPEPLIAFRGFNDSSMEFMIGAWCSRDDFLHLKNSLLRDMKVAFDKAGIEIPFPQRVVHMAPSTAKPE